MKNNIYFGISLGLIVPLLSLALIYGILEMFDQLGISNGNLSYKDTFRPRTLHLIALCINILALNSLRKYRVHDSIRGLVIITMILAILWCVLHFSSLF